MMDSAPTLDDTAIAHPVLKAASVGVAWLAGMTWGELASALAAAYTLLLIIDWLWKRLGKPFALHKGWIAGKPRDFMDITDRGDL